MSNLLFAIIAFLAIIVGLVGLFVPMVPSLPIAWLGLFFYALVTHFKVVSFLAILVFLILTLMTMLLDFLLPLLGAKKFNSSRYGLIGAVIGLLVGPMLLGPVGLVLGSFLGAVLGELYNGQRGKSLEAGLGVFVGFMLSIGIRLIVLLLMLVYFIYALIGH